MKIFTIFLILILSNSTNIYGQTVVVGQKKDSLNTTHIVLNCASPILTKENSPLFEFRINNLVFVIDLEDSLIIAKIDPRWIESVNIIKGQNAIEQYGSRAKNGVVLIGLIPDSLNILPVEIKRKLKPIKINK